MVGSELLLGLGYGNFPELLEIVHKSEGGLAGAGTGSLVSLLNLGVSIHDESVEFFLDLCDKLFHFFKLFNELLIYNTL